MKTEMEIRNPEIKNQNPKSFLILLGNGRRPRIYLSILSVFRSQGRLAQKSVRSVLRILSTGFAYLAGTTLVMLTSHEPAVTRPGG